MVKKLLRLAAAVAVACLALAYQAEQEPLQAQYPTCQAAWFDCVSNGGCLQTYGDNQCYNNQLIVQVQCMICGSSWVINSGGCVYDWCPGE